MKKLIRLSVLAVAALFFASCAIVDSPTGSITFAFPSGALSRGIGDETYKVAIYYGLDRYDVAPAVTGDELSFADLPTGDVRIIVAKGTADTDGFFYAEEYGQLFITIVPGENGPYDLDLVASDFAWVDSLKGEDVNGLAELEGTFYASTVSSLVEGTYTSGEFVVADGPAVPDGMAVDSISVGKVYESLVLEEQIWVNGSWSSTDDGGIVPWVDDELDLTFASGFGNANNRQDGVVSDFNVAFSGAFEVPGENGLAIVFQRDGGMGGVYLADSEFGSDPEDWPWIVDDINFEELLADVVDEGTEFVKDLIVSEESSAAYIVTSIATLKVSEDVISDETGFSIDDIFSSDAVAFAPDIGSPIVCLDLGEGESGETLYVGTENGLYSGASSAETGEFFANGSGLIDGTAGYYIKSVSASPDGDEVAFAARRGGNELLIIVDIDTGDVVDLRDLQGLPGNRLHNLVWLESGVLAVSGDHGLAVIETADVF